MVNGTGNVVDGTGNVVGGTMCPVDGTGSVVGGTMCPVDGTGSVVSGTGSVKKQLRGGTVRLGAETNAIRLSFHALCEEEGDVHPFPKALCAWLHGRDVYVK